MHGDETRMRTDTAPRSGAGARDAAVGPGPTLNHLFLLLPFFVKADVFFRFL